MNNIINSSGIYDIKAYNLTTKNATVLSTLNIGGYIIGSGTGLSNLNYGSITNSPDLTLYDGWTKSGNALYTTNLTGFVGIGTSTPNQYNTAYKLKIYTPTYSVPLLVIDAGIDSYNNNQNARAIGKPLLGLGNRAWSDVGDYYGIGFGWHAGRTNDCYTCEIGCLITNSDNGEMGDLVFSTRNTNYWYMQHLKE